MNLNIFRKYCSASRRILPSSISTDCEHLWKTCKTKPNTCQHPTLTKTLFRDPIFIREKYSCIRCVLLSSNAGQLTCNAQIPNMSCCPDDQSDLKEDHPGPCLWNLHKRDQMNSRNLLKLDRIHLRFCVTTAKYSMERT